MDPVSAIGLAAAAVQFVGFSSTLISSTAEIYHSTMGASADIMSIENTYLKLGRLAADLESASIKARASSAPSSMSAPRWDPTPWTKDTADIQLNDDILKPRDLSPGLEQLLSNCQEDCNSILHIVGKLKNTTHLPTRWRSFRSAIQAHCKKGDIDEIERRLARTQGLLALEMSRISNAYHSIHYAELVSLRKESRILGMRQAKQLEAIEAILQKINNFDTERLPQNPTFSRELSSLEAMMSKVSLAEETIVREHAILRSLSFESRTARYIAIPEAHRETFQWVFCSEGATDTIPGIQDVELFHENRRKLGIWLKEGSGVFWVSGKPGSGKSTFMKFVADHPGTTSALSHWAGSRNLVLASYYFWSEGTSMQKTQQGLLQTLLHDILQACPNLISVTCGTRWTADVSSLQQPWSLSELRAAFRAIAYGDSHDHRFCFFIDGLDEYHDDHIDFCESLLSLLSATNIKLCLSSRPWNVFEDAFGLIEENKLYIHEVTRPDIFRYAQERLKLHPRWRVVSTRSRRALSLIESITEKSRGVFLWVFIVTNLLREGLTNDDSFSDLERRLDDFPAELEAFFKQILQSVPTFYHQKMAGTLRLALAAKEPLDTLFYSFHDDEYDDPNYPSNIWCFESNEDENNSRREQMIRRINGRCRGLLEEGLGRIHFLHRTVADFLRTADMTKFLDDRVAPWFNENLSILKAFTAYFRSMIITNAEISGHQKSPLAYQIRKALGYAVEAEFSDRVSKESLDTILALLNESITNRVTEYVIDNAEKLYWDDDDERQITGVQGDVDQVNQLCRTLILERPLLRHLSRELAKRPTYFSDFEPPASSLVLEKDFGYQTDWSTERLDLIKLLCFHNHSLNARLGLSQWSNTIWEKFYFEVIQSVGAPKLVAIGPRFAASLQSGLFSALLQHGADPNIRLKMDCQTCPACPAIVAFMLLAFEIPHNDQVSYLQALELFLQHGPELGVFRSEVNLLTLQAMSNKCDHKSPQETFLERLRGAFKTGNETSFLSSVTKTILPAALAAHWPVEQYITEILEPKTPVSPSAHQMHHEDASQGQIRFLKRPINDEDILDNKKRTKVFLL
ncbi:nacht nucleoside triphosphatase [Paramyrothecium foliicola]|nr:nacht nucleoside triphosphatase [Paramyrothecium foliicola]